MLNRLSPLLLLAAGASVAPQWTAAGGRGDPAADTGDHVRYTLAEGETLEALAEEHFLRPEDWRKARALNGAAAETAGVPLRLDTGWLKRTPLAAEVVAFRGDARARVAGADIAVHRGLVLSEGDRLSTGPEGFVTVRLPDGSLLSLPTHSTIRFDRLRRYSLNGALDRRVHVETGAAESRVTPLRDETSRYEVRTGLGVAAVRGTRFRIGFTPGQMLAEVSEGRVGVRGGEGALRETLLGAGFGLVVGPAGAGRPIRLPAAPTFLAIPAQRAATGAVLRVRAEDGLSYRATLATDPDFVDRVAERQAPDGQFRFDGLAPGTYHVAVSAVLPSGLAGPAAVTRFDWGGPTGPAPSAGPKPRDGAPGARAEGPAGGEEGGADGRLLAGIAVLGEAGEQGAGAGDAFAAPLAAAFSEGDAEGDADPPAFGQAIPGGPWSGPSLIFPAGWPGREGLAPPSGFGASIGGGAGFAGGSGRRMAPGLPGSEPPAPFVPDAPPAPASPVPPPPLPPAPGPSAPSPPHASPTPEPAAWAQLIAGFALMGTVLRRIRSRGQASACRRVRWP